MFQEHNVLTGSDLEPEQWNAFVRQHPHGHVLQSWPWGELKSSFGWQPERLALSSGSHLVAGAQVLFRPLPAGLGTLAYVPKGPLLDPGQPAWTASLMAALHDLARERRAVCLVIEPELPDEPEQRSWLASLGFQPGVASIQPRRTLLVDLTADEQAILARMKPKTRYNIGLASRRGVQVRPGTQADLGQFYELMVETSRRDGFPIHSLAYYEEAFRRFVLPGWGQLLLAVHNSLVLAGLMVFVWGQGAWYMYGASSSVGRDLMPNYLLQWTAMRWAREQGCRTYDLWGVPDEEEAVLEAQFTSRQDGLWGVYRFKRGFGGRLVRYLGAWDYVYASTRYWLYLLAWRARRRTWS